MAVTVTFGKAFGVSGACVLCSKDMKEILINKARTFIFTTASPPCIPAMVSQALKIIERESWRREMLWERARRVRAILKADSVEPGWAACSPIIAFPVSGARRALHFSQLLGKEGIDMRAIRYPTVAEGKERLRISLSLHVSEEDALRTARRVEELWRVFSREMDV
jgi:8-amino-7-oxononanoate synthase